MSTRFATIALSALILMGVAAPAALAETSVLQRVLTDARILRGEGEDIMRPTTSKEVNTNLVAAPASDIRASVDVAPSLPSARADREANSRR